MAFGVRASHLFCGNARRIYVLLVLGQARFHRVTASSSVSRFGASSYVPAGGRGSRAGCRDCDAPWRLASFRLSTNAKSALNTDLRCAREDGERGLGSEFACASAARNSASVRSSFEHDASTSLSSAARGFFKTSESTARCDAPIARCAASSPYTLAKPQCSYLPLPVPLPSCNLPT